MAFVLSDRIKETTTTTSTGTYTLGGAVSGFETFTANLSNGDTTYYCCTDGTDFEVGLGTFASSGTTLARTTIISSSNSNNAVNWSSGSRDIFCTLPGSKAVFKDGDGFANFADNERVRFGSDNDGYLRHTGSIFQLISDTGGLNLKTNADNQDVIIQTDDGSGGTTDYLRADGSSGAVKLFHYGSTKLETESTGVAVTGNLEAEGGYIGFGTISTDNWGKLEFLSSDPTQFTSQFGNAVSLDNEQGSTNQQLFLFDTSSNSTSDLLGVAASGVAILSITGQGNIVFKRPNGDTSSDITLACPTPSAARTVTLPDATGTVALTSDITVTASSTTTFTNKTLTSPKINEDVAVTATATEINKLDGVTATTTELNYVDVTTLGTVQASKAVTADSDGNVKFSDSDELKFGDSGDLRILHNGSHSIIKDGGTGDLELAGSTVKMRNAARNEEMIVATQNGAVELYHNAVKKVETTPDGATVTGDLEILSTDAGASSAPLLELYRHSASPAASDFLGRIDFYGEDDNDDKLRYASITSSIMQPTHGNERGRLELDIMQNGFMVTFLEMAANTISMYKPTVISNSLAISSTVDGGPVLNLVSNDPSDVGDFGIEGTISYLAENSASEQTTFAQVKMLTDDVTDGTEDGRLVYSTMKNGTLTELLHMTSTNILIFNTTPLSWYQPNSTNFVVQINPPTPTAHRNINLPDASGTVLTTGNSNTPTTTTSSSDADFVLVDDGGTMKKITPSNLGITGGGASKGFAVAMAIAL